MEGNEVNNRARATATSNFGVSRRESHDSRGFYARFSPPVVSNDEAVRRPRGESLDRIFCGDARHMDEVADASVALVVTSPPYFAGKAYEEALGQGHIPATYLDYLKLLEEVFAECVRKLEPGGRIAVNVANLGRKPYRSLSADVTTILQDRLKLLLRGEIIWVKGKSAGNSCAWGSFQSAANPVLRDLTERIVVASKGRFGRARSRRRRAKERLPSEVSLLKDDFMEYTTDLWHMQPESAIRVNHPAPFPVELPERLINLYTYYDDLVLDPFIGSGTTAVAAVRTGRHFVGYDTDPEYKRRAEARVEGERRRLALLDERHRRKVLLPATPPAADEDDEDFQARAVREGRAAKEIARDVLERAGFVIAAEDQRLDGGVEISFVATDRQGGEWLFDVSGAFTSNRPGLKRADALWKALGKAAVLSATGPAARLVFLTTDLPAAGSPGDVALDKTRERLYHSVIEMLSASAVTELERLAAGLPAGHEREA
jgi:site-specific DNA-methyltransferase (adenine-specific)